MTETAISVSIGQLYSDHGRWLSRWLNRRTACPQRADDLAHDTFCRLLEKGNPLGLQDPRNYLVAVARRLLIDDVRRRQVEQAYLDALALDANVDALDPERILAAVQLLDSLVRLLSGLPDPVREAFLLRRLEGYSHEQVAQALGVSLRTVKRYVAQAYAHCYALAWPEG